MTDLPCGYWGNVRNGSITCVVASEEMIRTRAFQFLQIVHFDYRGYCLLGQSASEHQ